MIHKVLSVLLPLTLLTLSGAAAATEAQARLQRFVADVQTLSAQFEQVQYDEQGRENARRAGSFDLARPGRFKWHYQTPYEQLMLSDGQKIWNYEPDLAQVTVRDAAQILRDTPAALLAQGGDIEKTFSVTDAGVDGDAQKLRLEPKAADADIRLIELWLQANGTPLRMRLHDPLGGTSDIRFSAVNRNAKIASSVFQFTPPKGVEVVDFDAALPQ
ncbi:MAG: outer membrane lipoprotein chaperone LolA [Pseudomonadota bacterium]|nr:outer membrane lipoprotein chaperone LolA [Pseudomonadota bacterium]